MSNHKDLLPGVDGRSRVARRYRDVLAQVVVDQGGLDGLSEVRLQLCRRFAALAAMAEQAEAGMANGQEVDLQQYSTLVSTAVRVAQRIGINRMPKDVTSVKEYIEGRAA